MLRILLIEDDDNRVDKIRNWLPEDVKLVHAASAGRVLGILKRDRNSFAGIMLDHDLQIQASTDKDAELSGSTIVLWIREFIATDVPIFVHSMNPSKGPAMKRFLEENGYNVTRMPMADLNENSFMSWLEYVRECHEDRS